MAKPRRVHFGEKNFRELMDSAGFTSVEDCAEFLGVSYQTVYRYIRHGAPYVVCLALEYRAGWAPGYSELCFRPDGVWFGLRRLVSSKDLAQFDWLMEKEFQRGISVGRSQCLSGNAGAEPILQVS